MEEKTTNYHALVSKIMIVALLVPAVAPLYLLWTQTQLQIQDFIEFLILCLVLMVGFGCVSLYLHHKATKINKGATSQILEKLRYYESFIERGHRIARAFFNEEDKKLDNKNTKKAWFLLLFPLPLIAYSPVLLILTVSQVPFYFFAIFLVSTFVLSICVGWFVFRLYKKVALIYERKKRHLLKQDIKDSDIELVDYDTLKELAKMWRQLLKDETVKQCVDEQRFDESIKDEPMYQNFITNWRETLDTEKEINIKMALQFYLLMEYIEDNNKSGVS